jgi:hypothetical protein
MQGCYQSPPHTLIHFPHRETGMPYCHVPDGAPHSSTSHQGWRGGLFDRGSWFESHPEWARTVVTGRARLGGIPVGVIAVETQVVKRHLPADPGMPDSSEQVIPQVTMSAKYFDSDAV